MEREPEAAVRGGVGCGDARRAERGEVAAVTALRDGAEVLSRSVEDDAASLFCADFGEPEGGHRDRGCEWGWVRRYIYYSAAGEEHAAGEPEGWDVRGAGGAVQIGSAGTHDVRVVCGF